MNQLTIKDMKSDQEVRWCPGCGDYAILNSLQAVMADIGVKRENTVVLSGIGCSSRLPYYMSTYGFHGIHGRALAIATGVKTANQDLDVWVITGDGDSLSIGGNHLIHTLRRNVNLKIIVFNNRIYGLTKGQYSPTTPMGHKTKTSPYGAVDKPFNPMQLALGAGASFVARTLDTQPKHLKSVLAAAAAHKGSAFVEIWQNCVIFYDGAFKDMTAKENRDDKLLYLEDGQPMVFGSEQDKGLKFDCCQPVLTGSAEASTWDLNTSSIVPAQLVTSLDADPSMPKAMGVIRRVEEPTYDEMVNQQVATLQERKKGGRSIEELIYTPDVWTVG